MKIDRVLDRNEFTGQIINQKEVLRAATTAGISGEILCVPRHGGWDYRFHAEDVSAEQMAVFNREVSAKIVEVLGIFRTVDSVNLIGLVESRIGSG